MPKLSRNFHSKEIFKDNWKDVPLISQHLAEHLAKYTLQPIRDRMGIPMKISSGARNSADVTRLTRQGYNVSSTTDHFFGQGQRIKPTSPKNRAKIKKFGAIYSFSVGAVDYFPIGKNTNAEFMLNHFREIVEMNEDEEIFSGQIILEKAKTFWIHISNNTNCKYTYNTRKFLGLHKNKYLISDNNGKSYKIFNP